MGAGERERKEERGRGRERESERSSVHAPLPTQRGLLPGGGTQTLSPCPALYSRGNCSQINLAGYPVEVSPVQCSVAPRALHTGWSFRRNGGWWRTNLYMRHWCRKNWAWEKAQSFCMSIKFLFCFLKSSFCLRSLFLPLVLRPCSLINMA